MNLTGQTISHYRIIQKIGQGGMGVVYKAEDLKLERQVALKLLSPIALNDPDGQARFLNEARAAAALDHPHICTVYEIDESDQRLFLTMPFIAGRTLHRLIGEGPLPLKDALEIATQLADALDTAHAHGVQHRDIKPENVILADRKDKRIHVRLTDFGLARLAEATRLTREGTTLGTARYMSPEQVSGTETDHRTDIWSLGVVLYEMVAGHPPFQGDYEFALSYGITHETPTPLTAVRTDVPLDLERTVHKCLAKQPDDRYQSAAELLVDLRAVRRVRESVERTVPSLGQEKRPGRAIQLALALAMVSVTAVLTWWLSARDEPLSRSVPIRLTADFGLTFQPALSADGTLLAYSSDRSGEGHLDIWVQQVRGQSQPIRLTQHEADDYAPCFSPDGTRIAFRSDRDGGAIYVIPSLGGEPAMIAEGGHRPKFSPDGSLIAYKDGDRRWGQQLFVVPSLGGQSRPLLPVSEGGVRRLWFHPIWAPAGDSLLSKVWTDGVPDWGVVPLSGGAAVEIGAQKLLDRNRLASGEPEAWHPVNRSVIFSAVSGTSRNLWEVRLSPDNDRVQGAPRQLTFGPGSHAQVSISRQGRIAFADLSESTDLWSLPIDPNRGVVEGEIERLSHDLAWDDFPSISDDGTVVVFGFNRYGKDRLSSASRDVWIQHLPGGQKTAIAATAAPEDTPRISADGSKVAYRVMESGREAIYVVSSRGGLAERVCAECGEVTDWSSSGAGILYSKNGIGYLNLNSGQTTELLEDGNFGTFQAQFSPDEQWVSFIRIPSDIWQRSQVFVAPFNGEAKIDESTWVAVTDGTTREDTPRWSPDGTMLYFQSMRDGFLCVWAQRLSQTTKAPLGNPVPIHHFHRVGPSPIYLQNPGLAGLALARDRLVLALAELRANIWILENSTSDFATED